MKNIPAPAIDAKAGRQMVGKEGVKALIAQIHTFFRAAPQQKLISKVRALMKNPRDIAEFVLLDR